MTGRLVAVLLAGGFSLWALAFVVLYGALSVGCDLGWHERAGLAGLSLQRTQLLGLFFLHLAAASAMTAWTWRAARAGVGTAAFAWTVGRWTAVAALGATVFTFLGLFVLPTCL